MALFTHDIAADQFRGAVMTTEPIVTAMATCLRDHGTPLGDLNAVVMRLVYSGFPALLIAQYVDAAIEAAKQAVKAERWNQPQGEFQ